MPSTTATQCWATQASGSNGCMYPTLPRLPPCCQIAHGFESLARGGIVNGSLPAECLVAMTGIFPTRAPSELTIRGADSYPSRIRRRLAAFLAAEEVAPMEWERPPAQADLWKDLTTPLNSQKITAWLEGLENLEMVAGYSLVIEAAREYVKKAWPIYPDSSLGLRNVELAPDEYGDVWHLTRTLNDPETLFDDLDSLLLLPVQVEAFAAVYPDLYEATKNIAILLLQPFTEIEGFGKKHNPLRWGREEQIRTLLQIPNDAPIETAEPQEKQGATPDKRQESEPDDAQTPSEHTAARRIANK